MDPTGSLVIFRSMILDGMEEGLGQARGFVLGRSYPKLYGLSPGATFVYDGLSWTGPILLGRLGWVGAALVLAAVSAALFDRFDPARARLKIPQKGRKAQEKVSSQVELSAAPGHRVEYSCLGFILLGKALERIYDAPLQRIFTDRVLEPLHIEDRLGFNVDPETRTVAGGSITAQPELRMTAEMGHPVSEVPPVGSAEPHDGNARFLGGAAGNSGLFGSAEGLFLLASEYLEGAGTLLAADEIEAAATPVAADLHQVRGLGWQLGLTPGCSAGPRLGPSAFGHVGFTGTSVWVDPSLDAVFVLLTNRCHPDFREIDLHPLRRRFHSLAVRHLVSKTAN